MNFQKNSHFILLIKISTKLWSGPRRSLFTPPSLSCNVRTHKATLCSFYFVSPSWTRETPGIHCFVTYTLVALSSSARTGYSALLAASPCAQAIVTWTCLLAISKLKCRVRYSSSFIHAKKSHVSTPLIRTLVIRITNYPDRLGPSGKFVEKSTELTCPEITGYLIKYSTVLWLIELQICRDRRL